ncbi:MAG: hypothetical protein WBB45_21295 [Cyclobacteriaceae bacterium]
MGVNFVNSSYTALILPAIERGHINSADIISKVDSFSHLIQSHVHTMSIPDAINALIDKAFKVRMEAIAALMHDDTLYQQAMREISALGQSYQQPYTSYTDSLNAALHESMEVYKFMSASDHEYGSTVQEPQAAYGTAPDVGGVLSAISSIAAFHILLDMIGFNARPLIHMLKFSLAFEVGLVIATMHDNKELQLTTAQMDELARHLFIYIEEFGLAAVRQQMWSLPEDDTHQTIRNIKIRIAMDEVNQGRMQPVSAEGMKNMLYN